MTETLYPIVIVKLADEDGGGYLAYAPDLHGCMSDGESPQQAAENVQDAIRQWCAEMKELGRSIPEPGGAAMKEWKELLALIQQQDTIIKENISKLNEDVSQLKDGLRRIQARMKELMAREGQSLGGDVRVWLRDLTPASVGDCKGSERAHLRR